jgi:hypothetical protein
MRNAEPDAGRGPGDDGGLAFETHDDLSHLQ